MQYQQNINKIFHRIRKIILAIHMESQMTQNIHGKVWEGGQENQVQDHIISD